MPDCKKASVTLSVTLHTRRIAPAVLMAAPAPAVTLCVGPVSGSGAAPGHNTRHAKVHARLLHVLPVPLSATAAVELKATATGVLTVMAATGAVPLGAGLRKEETRRGRLNAQAAAGPLNAADS